MSDQGRAKRKFATWRRSRALLAAFRVEQTDPDRFYGLLAQDSAAQLGLYVRLDGAMVLDVGGGPGYFADAFEARGARYVALDADLGELSAKNVPGPRTVLGSGMDLPFTTAGVDVCYSSNVLEHVPHPERMADEMVRVTKPGGTVLLSYTTWLSPWGGHETAPWHYLGGARAARRYTSRTGHAPKNEYGRTLFPTSARTMLHWARTSETAGRVEIVDVFPRYHPGWAHWIVHVPVVREFGVWNLVLILRRTA